MEPFRFFRMPWEQEPRQLVGRGVLTTPPGGLGTARLSLRFMENPLSFLCMDLGYAVRDEKRR
jgi:hypothetical protein